MANKNRVWGYFTFGVVICAGLILSGLLIALLEMVISAITIAMFNYTFSEMLLQPRAEIMMFALALVLTAIFIGITALGFVFKKIGFRRN